MSDPKAEPAAPPPKKPEGMIHRGIYKPNPPSTTLLFFALRALDLPLQYKFLSGAWSVPLLSRLGLATTLSVTPVGAAASRTGIAAVDSLGLSGPGLLLLAMSAGAALKQSWWLAAVSREEMVPAAAVSIGVFNSVAGSVNSLLFAAAATSSTLSSPSVPLGEGATGVPLPIVLGAALFGAGIAIEAVSEQQRLRFKQRPENKGLICREGLWGWARHINYGGYLLWRVGYGLAAGGWAGGLLNFGFFIAGFVRGGIPELAGYMRTRYGEQWARYEREVKWALIPGIY